MSKIENKSPTPYRLHLLVMIIIGKIRDDVKTCCRLFHATGQSPSP